MKRAHERGWKEGGLLTPQKCELFWEKINELKQNRLQAHVINTENINIDEVYTQVTKIVGNN
jgi:broad-specificity NMP kinase